MNLLQTVAVINYGVGNYRAISNGLDEIGVSSKIISTPEELSNFHVAILPGVGSFDNGVRLLADTGFDIAILKHVGLGRRLIGVCLGMQLLFESSQEGQGAGLGILQGQVESLERICSSTDLRVPVHGWFPIEPSSPTDSFERSFYFSHSYGIPADHPYVTHSYRPNSSLPPVAARVQLDQVIGLQFHPERSGVNGLLMLHDSIPTEGPEK